MNSAIKLKVFRGCNILNITTKFSERLKKLRESNNMNCTQLAKQLNVSSASIGYYEKGERVPDIEVLARICDFFNVSSDYLIGISDFASKDIEKKAVADYIGLDEKSVDEIKRTTEDVILKSKAQLFIQKHLYNFMELMHQINADSGGLRTELGYDEANCIDENYDDPESWENVYAQDLFFKKEFDRYQAVKYVEIISDEFDETVNPKREAMRSLCKAIERLSRVEIKIKKRKRSSNAQHNET